MRRSLPRAALTARLLLLSTGVLAAIAAAACSNPFAVKATSKVIEDTLAVYGLSGAPPSVPTALNTFGPKVVRADPSQDYDVVFDIRVDSAGDTAAYILPPRAVGLLGPQQTGLIKDTTQTFDAITRAPTSGYNDSTIVRIKPGDVVLVQAQSSACGSQVIVAREFIYSKIVIDSIHYSPFDALTNPAGNSIYFRVLVDPNCGFVSFEPGLPTF